MEVAFDPDMNVQPDDAVRAATAIPFPGQKLGPQVLVVDDSPFVREFIAQLVSLSGCRVLEAADGRTAMTILSAAHPALVISDLEMPVCDGWEVLAYCHEQHPDIPVLIVSGADPGRHPEIARWAAGFLPKPFLVERFRAEIQRLICLAA